VRKLVSIPLLLLFSGFALATPATIIDGFEDADISEYTGDTSKYQVQNNFTLEGIYTLEYDTTFSGIKRSVSNQKPTEVSYLVHADGPVETAHLRLYDGSANMVIVGIGDNTGSFGVQFFDGSNYVQVASANVDTTYEIEIRDINYSNNSYDIYKNDTKVYDDASFRSAGSQITDIEWVTNPDSTNPDVGYFDFLGTGIDSVNDAPSLSNPDPADGAPNVNDTNDSTGIDVNISIDVTDTDNSTLEYVNLSWSNGTQFYSKSSVSSGSTVGTQVENLENGTTFEWFAEASDGVSTTQSSTFNFTTDTSSSYSSPTSEQFYLPEGDCPATDFSNVGVYGTCNGGVNTSVSGISKSQGIWDRDGDGADAWGFDGVDDNIDAGNDRLETDSDFSQGGWFKTSGDGIMSLYDERDSNFNGFQALINRDSTGTGDIRCAVQGSSNIIVYSTSTVLNDGNLHHYACTWDESEGNLSIYIDGNYENSATGSPGNTEVNVLSGIGERTGGSAEFADAGNFNGTLDEFRGAKVTWTKGQVNSLYTENTYSDNSATGSINVNTPLSKQVWQRNSSGKGDILVKGSITGSATAVEARFNGGSWQTVDETVSTDGSFKGYITGSEGSGRVDVRFKNDISVNTSVSQVGVGEVILQYGQSNINGKGNNLNDFKESNYNHFASFLSYETSSLQSADDPFYPDTRASFGSPWPELAEDIVSNQSVPVMYCSAAEPGGTAEELDKNSASGLYSRMLNVVDSCTSGTRRVGSVQFLNGETDAKENTGAETYSQYYQNISGLINDTYADLNTSNLKFDFYLGQIGGNYTNTTNPSGTASYRPDTNKIRRAQQNLWSNNPYTEPGAVLYDIPMSVDGNHFQTDSEIRKHGNRWYDVFLGRFGVTDGIGPSYSKVVNADSDTVNVVFDESLNTSQTLDTGIFRVKESGTELSVSSIGFKNSTTVQFNTSTKFTASNTKIFLGAFNDAHGKQTVFGLEDRTGQVANTFYGANLSESSDTNPPTTTDDYTQTGYQKKSQQTVTLTSSDTESSVANISYRVNGGSYTTVQSSSTDVLIDTTGNNTLEYFATDTKGNQESVNTEYVALRPLNFERTVDEFNDSKLYDEGYYDSGVNSADGSFGTSSLPKLESIAGDQESNFVTSPIKEVWQVGEKASMSFEGEEIIQKPSSGRPNLQFWAGLIGGRQPGVQIDGFNSSHISVTIRPKNDNVVDTVIFEDLVQSDSDAPDDVKVSIIPVSQTDSNDITFRWTLVRNDGSVIYNQTHTASYSESLDKASYIQLIHRGVANSNLASGKSEYDIDSLSYEPYVDQNVAPEFGFVRFGNGVTSFQAGEQIGERLAIELNGLKDPDGNFKDADIVVKENGNQIFSTTVTQTGTVQILDITEIKDAKYTVEGTLTDEKGKTKTFTESNTVQEKKPVINLQAPGDGETLTFNLNEKNKKNVEFDFQIEDNNNFDGSYSILLNGSSIKTGSFTASEFNSNDELDVQTFVDVSPGTYNHTLQVNNSETGNTFVSSGNLGQTTFTVEGAEATPTVTIDSPTEGDTIFYNKNNRNNANVTVSGSVDTTFSGNADVLLDGATVASFTFNNGTTSYSESFTASNGSHNIKISLTSDTTGTVYNSSTRSFKVEGVDEVPPEITVTQPDLNADADRVDEAFKYNITFDSEINGTGEIFLRHNNNSKIGIIQDNLNISPEVRTETGTFTIPSQFRYVGTYEVVGQVNSSKGNVYDSKNTLFILPETSFRELQPNDTTVKTGGDSNATVTLSGVAEISADGTLQIQVKEPDDSQFNTVTTKQFTGFGKDRTYSVDAKFTDITYPEINGNRSTSKDYQYRVKYILDDETAKGVTEAYTSNSKAFRFSKEAEGVFTRTLKQATNIVSTAVPPVFGLLALGASIFATSRETDSNIAIIVVALTVSGILIRLGLFPFVDMITGLPGLLVLLGVLLYLANNMGEVVS